jgi:hypothetical protein
MGGECGLIREIRATSVPIDDLVPRSGPTPVTFGSKAEGRPPVSLLLRWRTPLFTSGRKRGQGSQGTESPAVRLRDEGCKCGECCRRCLIACNTRQFDEVPLP